MAATIKQNKQKNDESEMVFVGGDRERGSKRSDGSQSNTLGGLSASFKDTVLSDGEPW